MTLFGEGAGVRDMSGKGRGGVVLEAGDINYIAQALPYE